MWENWILVLIFSINIRTPGSFSAVFLTVSMICSHLVCFRFTCAESLWGWYYLEWVDVFIMWVFVPYMTITIHNQFHHQHQYRADWHHHQFTTSSSSGGAIGAAGLIIICSAGSSSFSSITATSSALVCENDQKSYLSICLFIIFCQFSKLPLS